MTQISFSNSGDPATPIRLSFRASIPDEDGARAGAEVLLSLEDMRKVLEMGRVAIEQVEKGVWP